MSKDAAEKKLVAVPDPEELDNLGEIQPATEPDDSGETEAVVGEEGYGDREKVVVPICDNLQELILKKCRKDLQYVESFLNAGQLTDNPALDKDVKSMSREAKSLREQIAKLEAELEAKKKK